MKTLLFVFVLSFLTFGCKKEEPAVPAQQTVDTLAAQPGRPDPPGDKRIPPHARKTVGAVDINSLRTHASAAKVYIELPDSLLMVPLAPGVRPLKNLKLIQSTDDHAVYQFTNAHGRIGDMALGRHIMGSDTIWIPLHIMSL